MSKVLLSIFIMSFAGHSFAYSCQLPSTAENNWKYSDAVFEGIIQSVQYYEAGDPIKGYVSASLAVKVTKPFKGASKGKNLNIDIRYSMLTLDPPPQFKTGETYFIDSSKNPKTGQLETDVCPRTRMQKMN